MQKVRIERNLDPVFRAQLKGTTEAINSTAGYKGVLVLNTDTNHLHVLTGEAGSSIELASRGDAIEISKVTNLQSILDTKASTSDVADLHSKKADLEYVKNELKSKANSAELTANLDKKADKTAIADMLTNEKAKTTYLGISAKAESAKSADSVAWNNVTGKEKVRTTDTPISMKDFGGPIDLGMIK